jgi:hypothetical protein
MWTKPIPNLNGTCLISVSNVDDRAYNTEYRILRVAESLVCIWSVIYIGCDPVANTKFKWHV